MAISLFELFKVGIGPSSSHTVGPMRAAGRFVAALEAEGLVVSVNRLKVSLYGSLGATGKGHGTGPAVMMGLEGELPDRIDPEQMPARLGRIRSTGMLSLSGQQPVRFRETSDLVYYRRKSLPDHPNGMICLAFDPEGRCLCEKTYYSVGGGFVMDAAADGTAGIREDDTPQPYPFGSGKALLALCRQHDLTIAEIMYANEQAWRTPTEIRCGILELWRVMRACVQNGIRHEGELPGGLRVRRRAALLYRSLMDKQRVDLISPSLSALDWVNLYALAVNEENAAGGRIVTAPTNGAAGIIPAVLHYYWEFCPHANEDGIVRFMLTAAAIGLLFKKNASISGAEVGCQGEVGSACAMAAAGLAAATGGSPEQVENAAEIGMEHHLGMTCDPIGGLVQIPCIERNAMASVKAIDAAIMALRGDGKHFVSLDKVLHTMRETGRDMLDKYKETARGGLAVNIIEC
ncbi:L-serine ammonia-lyase [Marinobacter orientalis]|uniref:L-serine dehydratase n=1 Tax=Marinobacter orientalis TaxID=1928859 RepID=A0A7Y0WT04_9GAMM|nr:L-serine ammonia-lyase [Marinobacter orientalis]NMT64270.1 L-serine ammonia-lyase [Marinobacter orientalis]TGX49489.1 L-serine ammonia-lyase [Marinobacter orientalis]